MPNFSILHRSFSYDRQPLEDGNIRLITLLPGTRDDRICCNLQTAKLSEIPSYEALSYTWRKPDKLGLSIFLDERRFRVRENLWWALFHLRHTFEARVLWIDAICINQKNVLERNNQVEQMDRVYSQAGRVLVWLGRQDKESAISLAFLNRLCLRPEKEDEDITELLQLDENLPLDEALKSFLHTRKYWSRLWIVQEILLGNNILLHCGDDSLPWESLSSGIRRVRNFLDTERRKMRSLLHLHHGVLETAIETGSAARLDKLRAQISAPNFARGNDFLRDLIGTVQLAGCSERRDKIYGLLGLGIAAAGFPIDYRKTMFEVYTDALSVINKSDSFDDSGQELNVPRFSQILQKLLNGPFPNTKSTTPWVNIKGFIAGEILYVNDPKSEVRDLRWQIQRSEIEASISIRDQYPKGQKLLGSLYFRYAHYNPGQLPYQLSNSAPSFERFNPVHLCMPCIPHYFEVVRRSSGARLRPPTRTINRLGSVPHSNSPKTSERCPLVFITSGKVSRVGVVSSSEEVKVIQSPILGFGPPDAKPGDKIIQFMDTDVSMVIRGSEDKGYSFIGRAFIPLYGDGFFHSQHYIESRTRDNVPLAGSAPVLACYEEKSGLIEDQMEFLDVQLDTETLQFLTCEGKYEDIWKE